MDLQFESWEHDMIYVHLEDANEGVEEKWLN